MAPERAVMAHTKIDQNLKFIYHLDNWKMAFTYSFSFNIFV